MKRGSQIILLVGGILLVTGACGYRLPTSESAAWPVLIQAEGNRFSGELDHAWEYMTGSGNASLYLRVGWKDRILAHLADVHTNLGIQTVRFHGIFLDEVGVYQGPGQYDFTGVDQVYDSILAIGVKPFVELSFMPEKLAACKKRGFPSGYRPFICPPKDYEEWGKMIRAFAGHLVARYGREEVRTWGFEVWNEPNLAVFWGGSKEDYFKLYEVTSKALKSVDPALKVGGPATSAATDPWLWDLIVFCHQHSLPLDFISLHGYGNESLAPLEKEVREAGFSPQVVTNQGFYFNEVRVVNQLLKASPFPALPLYITEWNSSVAYSYRMNLWPNDHDLPNDAAFMCAAVKETNGYTQGFSHWTHSDVFEEWGLPGEKWPVKKAAFHGGFGLITIHGVHKPSYHAFAFLHQMGKKLLETKIEDGRGQVEAMITLDDGKLRVLVWYYLDPFKNKSYSGPTAEVTIKLKQLPEELRGKSLRGFRIDQDHGNPFAEWLRLGQPGELTPEQVARLQRASDQTLSDPQLTTLLSGPELTLTFALPPAALVFLATE